MLSFMRGKYVLEKLLLIGLLLAELENATAFQYFKAPLLHNSQKTVSTLSVSVATSNFNAEYHMEEDNQSSTSSTPETSLPKGKSSSQNSASFIQHMQKISRYTSNAQAKANRLDDALMRQEVAFYNLSGDDLPEYRFSEEDSMHYTGPCVPPIERCYELVCNAYANSGLGIEGAMQAEAAMKRFERFHDATANASIRTAVMNAWIAAGEWDKANQMLATMEKTYAETNRPEDSPTILTYNAYLEGLMKTKSLTRKSKGDLSIEVLGRLRENFDFGLPLALPNRATYNAVMKCQKEAYYGIKSVSKCREIFHKLQEDYTRYNDKSLLPTAPTALQIVYAASNCEGNTIAIEYLEELYTGLENKYEETGMIDFRPNKSMYITLLKLYSKVHRKDAKQYAYRVNDVLQRMEKYNLQIDMHVLTAALNAKVNHNCPQMVAEAEELMKKIEHPDSIAYQCLIRANCRLGNESKAASLIHELEELSQQPAAAKRRQFPVDVLTLGIYVSLLGKETKQIGMVISKAEHYLNIIIQRYKEDNFTYGEKDVDTWVFEAMARLFAKSRRANSGEKIEELISKMEELNALVPHLFHSNLNLYTLALDGWATSRRADSGTRSNQLLEKMRQLHSSGLLPEPNNRCISATFGAVVRSNKSGSLSMAERLYQEMLTRCQMDDDSARVNEKSLVVLLSSILNSSDAKARQRGSALLRQMILLGKKDIKKFAPNTFAFNTCLNSFAKKREATKAWELFQQMKQLEAEGFPCAPDNASISCVVRAVGTGKMPWAMEKLDDIHRDIIGQPNNRFPRPDIHLLNHLVSGYKLVSKLDSTAADRANEILMHMETIAKTNGLPAPDIDTYREVCLAFALSNGPNSTENAEKILRRAEALALKGELSSPGPDIYSAMMLAYSRKNHMEEAERVLDKMEEMAKSGLKDYKLSTRLYNIVLRGYAKNREDYHLEKPVKILERMITASEGGNRDCDPNVASFNLVIEAASNRENSPFDGYKDQIEIALKYFKLLHTGDVRAKPNSATYELFLDGCYHLLPEGDARSKLTSKAFDLCIKRGLVTATTCSHAYKCNSKIVLEALATSRKKEEENTFVIPADWSVHVPQRKRDKEVTFNC